MSSKSMCGNPNWCSICGLRIPEDVCHHNHPLFGTVDHIVPRFLGGADTHANRAPAHKYCNRRKGHCASLPYEIVRAIQVEIVRHLLAMGFCGKNVDLVAARKRLGLPEPPPEPRVLLDYRRMSAMQWEDDGGCVVACG